MDLLGGQRMRREAKSLRRLAIAVLFGVALLASEAVLAESEWKIRVIPGSGPAYYGVAISGTNVAWPGKRSVRLWDGSITKELLPGDQLEKEELECRISAVNKADEGSESNTLMAIL